MNCPCQNCPHRMLVCHDHCDEYAEYHAVLEARREAKQAYKKANEALGLLVDSYRKKHGRWEKKHICR